MSARSLRTSEQGKKIARRALKGKGMNQTKLIPVFGCSRQPISHFFNCKPVDSELFLRISEYLGLNWQEIADLPEIPDKEKPDTDALVQEVRQKIRPYIQQRCGKMQVLDMTQPISLGDIYTHVNVLEKITARTRRGLAELGQLCGFEREDFDRLGFGKISQEGVPGLEVVQNHKKLIVWGKPGAGKTTFMKYLAIACLDGDFQNERVPIFVTLKEFAESPQKHELLSFITEQLKPCQIDANQITEVLRQGKALILLDGLDEVRQEDSQQVIHQIQRTADHVQYCQNQFVVTCRIAAKEYTFQGFTEIEVADFNLDQIKSFVANWFKDDTDVTKKFIDKLQDGKSIFELATRPLLLTLLCLIFEETRDFAQNRAELYKEGIDVLLKKWDAKRNIEREQVYRQLSTKRKEDLLSQIALTTFEKGDYFFKQCQVEQYIADYIQNLPDAQADPEALRLDSEAVLKSIEAQHGLLTERAKGIYSFSHLTFQEYFTAYKMTRRSCPLDRLVSHVTESRWQEVLLLATGIMEDATELVTLMKVKIDSITVKDRKIQDFLIWLSQKSPPMNFECSKLVDIRIFYFCLESTYQFQIFEKSEVIELTEIYNLCIDFLPGIAYSLEIDLYELLSLYDCSWYFPPSEIAGALDEFCKEYDMPNQFKRRLNLLKSLLSDLPDPPDLKRKNEFEKKWLDNKRVWEKTIREVLIATCDIGHNWQFSKSQIKLIKQYYEANLLLVKCLQSECYVEREARQKIEAELFLPMVEIQKQ